MAFQRPRHPTGQSSQKRRPEGAACATQIPATMARQPWPPPAISPSSLGPLSCLPGSDCSSTPTRLRAQDTDPLPQVSPPHAKHLTLRAPKVCSELFAACLRWLGPCCLGRRGLGHRGPVTVPFLAVPFLTVPFLTVLYVTVPFVTVLYVTVPFVTALFVKVPFLTAPFFTVLFVIAHFITIPFVTAKFVTVSVVTDSAVFVTRRPVALGYTPAHIIVATLAFEQTVES